jgi:hypothetical protein
MAASVVVEGSMNIELAVDAVDIWFTNCRARAAEIVACNIPLSTAQGVAAAGVCAEEVAYTCALLSSSTSNTHVLLVLNSSLASAAVLFSVSSGFSLFDVIVPACNSSCSQSRYAIAFQIDVIVPACNSSCSQSHYAIVFQIAFQIDVIVPACNTAKPHLAAQAATYASIDWVAAAGA